MQIILEAYYFLAIPSLHPSLAFVRDVGNRIPPAGSSGFAPPFKPRPFNAAPTASRADNFALNRVDSTGNLYVFLNDVRRGCMKWTLDTGRERRSRK